MVPKHQQMKLIETISNIQKTATFSNTFFLLIAAQSFTFHAPDFCSWSAASVPWLRTSHFPPCLPPPFPTTSVLFPVTINFFLVVLWSWTDKGSPGRRLLQALVHDKRPGVDQMEQHCRAGTKLTRLGLRNLGRPNEHRMILPSSWLVNLCVLQLLISGWFEPFLKPIHTRRQSLTSTDHLATSFSWFSNARYILKDLVVL